MEYDLNEKLQDGRPRYKQLDSGAIFDLSIGRIIAIDPSKNPYAITKENAGEMVAKRWRDQREAAIEGAAEGLEVRNEPAEVVKAVFRKIASLLNTSTNARNASEAARFLVEKSGVMPKEPENVTFNVFTTEERTKLLKMLRELDTVEGEIIHED